jgi:L-ascorbate metabolism protein UlaG (beta-lactamase superfamily)
MMILFILIGLMGVGALVIMRQPVFGKNPKAERLARMGKSTNYKNGSFHNQRDTPMMASDVSYSKLILNFFLGKPANTEPPKKLPSLKTDLKKLTGTEPIIVWFGHSSYFLRTNGKNFLIDPVLSGNASPVTFFAKSFKGSDVYSVEDFPELDGVILTHDHYDHLDYNTIVKLKEKSKHFYTALGVGSHLSHWGVVENQITEFDWWDGANLGEGIHLTAAPARHFSGRGFVRFKTLWVSFILKTPTHNFYLGGDSGYGDHFKIIGEKYGPFDIAFLECGQYDKQWPYIHMMPEETVQAGLDLKTKVLMPVHWGKFSLSMHPWNESIERASNEASRLKLKLATPQIGQPLLVDQIPSTEAWWRSE